MLSTKLSKNSLFLLFASLFLFLILLPLVSRINFPQNDDWVYYQNVELIKSEGLKLDPYLGPTFFVQGILGSLYSYVFPLATLPVFTLFLSVVSFFIFTKILTDYLNIDSGKAILLGLLFYLTPMNIYTSLGFMTSQYFLPWFLLAIYLFLSYEKKDSIYVLGLLLLTTFIALNQRQVALILPISFAFYYLLNKKIQKFLLFFADFVLMLSYYLFIFPRTEAMLTKSFAFNHFIEFDYIYALVYGTALIVVSLLLPLFFTYIVQTVKNKKILLTAGAIILYFILNSNFKPMEISWGEFPYFENTWERMGFYPRGVLGTKYQFIGNYDCYLYWDLTSKVLLAAFVVTLLFKFKRFINVFSLLYVFYIGIMVVTDTFYDRYILLLIPLTIFMLIPYIKFKRYTYMLIMVFLAFMGFYTYQFSMDFFSVNKYVWGKSMELVNTENIDPNLIQGTNAWKLKYRNFDRDYLYVFSYDSPDINEVFRDQYLLVEEKEINYPLNFFINPKVYLYKKL